VDLTADDLVVMMAFRRRPRIIRPLLQQLQRSGIPVLLMCEPQAHSLFPLALAALRAAGQRLGLRQLCLGQQPDQSAGQCLSA
jgi:DNA-binding MurR/RpiR family transcriptional regulator